MNKIFMLFAIFLPFTAFGMDCTLSRVLPIDNNISFEDSSGALGGWVRIGDTLQHTASAAPGERYRNATWRPTLRFSAGEEYTVIVTVSGIDGGRPINVRDWGTSIGSMDSDGTYEFDFVAKEGGFIEVNRQETTGADAVVHRVELIQEGECGISCDGMGLGEFFASFSCPVE